MPGAENFFGRISMQHIADALEEAAKPASAVTLAFEKVHMPRSRRRRSKVQD